MLTDRTDAEVGRPHCLLRNKKSHTKTKVKAKWTAVKCGCCFVIQSLSALPKGCILLLWPLLGISMFKSQIPLPQTLKDPKFQFELTVVWDKSIGLNTVCSGLSVRVPRIHGKSI